MHDAESLKALTSRPETGLHWTASLTKLVVDTFRWPSWYVHTSAGHDGGSAHFANQASVFTHVVAMLRWPSR